MGDLKKPGFCMFFYKILGVVVYHDQMFRSQASDIVAAKATFV